jgi:L-alanine-DL-glutamate epimerase-like enolase superfamily enzyme
MRIAQLEWKVYDSLGGQGRGTRPWLGLRLTTDGGAEGICALPPWPHEVKDADQRAKAVSVVVGEEPDDIDRLWKRMRQADVPLSVLSYVDVALWDLAARAAGKPAHALLGTKRDRIAVYRSTRFNEGDSEYYAQYVRERRLDGYRGVKIHPPHNDKWADGEARGDVEEDIRIARAAREAVGDDFPLMWDNYKTYTPAEAVTVGRVLDDLGYAWYESPMPETDEWLDRYLELKRQVQIRLCAPETHPGDHTDRIRWIEAGATDMGRLDVFFGGITSCWAVARECERRGIEMDLHCNLSPHLQIFGATSDETIPYMEDYGGALDFQLDQQGCVAIPSDPGACVGPDWDFICAHELEQPW